MLHGLLLVFTSAASSQLHGSGADPTRASSHALRCRSGQSPVMLAIAAGEEEIVLQLLRAAALVDHASSSGGTALMLAAEQVLACFSSSRMRKLQVP